MRNIMERFYSPNNPESEPPRKISFSHGEALRALYRREFSADQPFFRVKELGRIRRVVSTLANFEK